MGVFKKESLFSNPSCVEVVGKGLLSKGQEIKDIPGRSRERPKARLRMEKAMCAWGGENTQAVLCFLQLKAQGT